MSLLSAIAFLCVESECFAEWSAATRRIHSSALFGKGFGGGGSSSAVGKNNNKKKKRTRTRRLVDALEDRPKASASRNMPYVKSEQDGLLEALMGEAAETCIGRAVSSARVPPGEEIDPFWQLVPSLIRSRFPGVDDSKFERVAGMVRHALDPDLPLEDSIVADPHRPHDEIHAYMPGLLGERRPFLDPDRVELCRLLRENYETICDEYEALLRDREDRFQTVTSMNYESGWRTMVLFYNGHRIPGKA